MGRSAARLLAAGRVARRRRGAHRLLAVQPAGRLPAQAGETVAVPLRTLLAALPVRDEDRTGYARSKFRHWVDADRDGCNTRAEVLKDEALVPPEQSTSCNLAGGRWYSAYDDRYIDAPSGLDIDHRVPLAESWDSGASAWSAVEREAYANDLGDPRSLNAVSAASNRSKRPARIPPPGSRRLQATGTTTSPAGSR